MVPNLMHLGWTVRRVKVCSVSSLSSNCTSLFQDRICGRRELITREGAGRLKTSLSTRSTTQPHKRVCNNSADHHHYGKRQMETPPSPYLVLLRLCHAPAAPALLVLRRLLAFLRRRRQLLQLRVVNKVRKQLCGRPNQQKKRGLCLEDRLRADRLLARRFNNLARWNRVARKRKKKKNEKRNGPNTLPTT